MNKDTKIIKENQDDKPKTDEPKKDKRLAGAFY